MSATLLCPICKEEVVPSDDVEAGDTLACEKCGTVLVVRDKKAFKSLELQGTEIKKGEPVISL